MRSFVKFVACVLLATAPAYGQGSAQTITPSAQAPLKQSAATAAGAPRAMVTKPALSTPEQRSAEALALSHEPTFDEGTAQRIREAALSYSDLAVRGGWPVIPADAKFAIGVAGAHDDLLRLRLIITEDLAAEKGSGPFDDALAEAVKRFQVRHGLAATGTVTPRTLAALNVPVQKRIRQLEASLERLENMNFGFGQRYVVVNIPATFAEAVENDIVVRRYRVIVGKTEKPSPTLTAEITSVNLIRPGPFRHRSPRPRSPRICAKTLAICRACIWRCSTRMTARSIPLRWTGPARIRRISPCASRTAPGTRLAR